MPETSDHWIVGLAVHAWIDRAHDQWGEGRSIHTWLHCTRKSCWSTTTVFLRRLRKNGQPFVSASTLKPGLLVLDKEFARKNKINVGARIFERSETDGAGHLAGRPLLFRLMVNLARLGIATVVIRPAGKMYLLLQQFEFCLYRQVIG